ncbi:MFS transporter [Cryptosporangium aurantiacum]|uniref:Predicted arabinose efflux permease, MFS family n=1 Tax=Cryptosporangium aurantiacum TaxID=134849 RepID=A0A1M7RLX1_9ACTN|nr:MFS transporter [Cryptosporangium aurantiacum]SHN47254.1 Predicted arabinose efflux permease, MFS family [Cryptosporangium aurantiacum]
MTPFATTAPVRARRSETVLAVVLCVATGGYSVLQSLVVPALGVLEDALGTTPNGTAWILTAYLLSASILTPVIGRLGDLYGKKRALVGALVALCLGAGVSALADTLAVMLAGRVVQGAGGAVFPLAFAMVRDEFRPNRRTAVVAAISAVLSAGGALGTVVAGPIVTLLDYHWLFWLPALVTAAAALAALIAVPGEDGVRAGHRPPVGWVSAGLLSGWLTLLLLAITYLPGALPTLPLAVGAAVVAGIWWRVESTSRHPLLDLRTLRLPAVRVTNLATVLLGYGMFSAWMLIPLMLQQSPDSGIGLGADLTGVGLYMLVPTAGTLLVTPFVGRLARSRGTRFPLWLGGLLAGLAYLALAWFGWAGGPGGPLVLCGIILVEGAGIGLAFAAVAVSVVESVPADQAGVVSGVNTVMRTTGGTLGSTVAGTTLAAITGPAGEPGAPAYLLAFTLCAAALLGTAAVGRRLPVAPVSQP